MKRYCAREGAWLFLDMVEEDASEFILMLTLDRKTGGGAAGC